MTEVEILKVIAEWLLEHFDITVNRVQMTSSINEDLLLDSLDQVEVVMAIEETFSVEVDDVVAGQWKTIGDIVRFLAARPVLAPE